MVVVAHTLRFLQLALVSFCFRLQVFIDAPVRQVALQVCFQLTFLELLTDEAQLFAVTLRKHVADGIHPNGRHSGSVGMHEGIGGVRPLLQEACLSSLRRPANKVAQSIRS